MKTQLRNITLAAFAALTLAVSSDVVRAADDLIFPPTGAQNTVTGADYWWAVWWGIPTLTFDTTTPSPAGVWNETAGCLEVAYPFDGLGNEDGMIAVQLNGSVGWDTEYTKNIDASAYQSVQFDFKYDTTSTITPSTAAHIQCGLDSGYDVEISNSGLLGLDTTTVDPNTSTLYFDGNWHHVTIVLTPGLLSAMSTTMVYGPGFYTWNPAGTTGSMNYWLANVQMIAKPVVNPPPTLNAPTPAVPGLKVINTSPVFVNGGQRQHILTGSANYSFVGQSSVTYSWTNTTWPSISTANAWIQSVFLVGGTPGQYDQAIDWNMANVLWFTVQQAPDGSGYIQFLCKTNEPYGNAMFYNTTPPTYAGGSSDWPVGPLINLASTSPLGHWSVTITGAGVVTVTTPDNTSASYTLDAATVALFADPFTVALGDLPNGLSDGESQTIGSFQVSGNLAPFSDNFALDTTLNTTYWHVLAADPAGVFMVPPGSAWWVTWSIPDSGFGLQATPSLLPTSGWSDINGTRTSYNGVRAEVVPASAVGANEGFMRLIKRVPAQLLVLAPGMTATPGVSPGYSGSPSDQLQDSGGDLNFNVVVDMCDASWNLVISTDVITLTSGSHSGDLVINTDPVNLTAGTATYNISYWTDSTYTDVLTVSDTTDTSITPGVTPAIPIN